MTRHYGKYRGKVENNIDPLQLGRIQVECAGGARFRHAELGDAVRALRRKWRSLLRHSADRRQRVGGVRGR